MVGHKNADVRHDKAFPDGDEIYRPRSRRNKIGDGPDITKRCRLDIYNAAAKGRDDDAQNGGSRVRRDALMYIQFDQEINADAVLKMLAVMGQGKRLNIRFATQEEIDKDNSIAYYAKQAQPRRWLAFRAVNSDGLTDNAMPPASPITVTVQKGTPSGRRAADDRQTASLSAFRHTARSDLTAAIAAGATTRTARRLNRGIWNLTTRSTPRNLPRK